MNEDKIKQIAIDSDNWLVHVLRNNGMKRPAWLITKSRNTSGLILLQQGILIRYEDGDKFVYKNSKQLQPSFKTWKKDR